MFGYGTAMPRSTFVALPTFSPNHLSYLLGPTRGESGGARPLPGNPRVLGSEVLGREASVEGLRLLVLREMAVTIVSTETA